MFLLRRPNDADLLAFLHAQSRLDLTYSETGLTASDAPSRYVMDRTRVLLGTGVEVFLRAKESLKSWKQFEIGWLKALPTDTPISEGEVVAVVARTFGIWSLNAARIIYVVDEPQKFGFAYGTLPGHVETGEERFLIERTDDDSVWYDILAFSRPRHLLTMIGYPFVRRLQKRFGQESATSMLKAVRSIDVARKSS